MTTETKSMDFSGVGLASMQAAVEILQNGMTEQEFNRIGWLGDVLHLQALRAGGVRRLAQWDDQETLNQLSSVRERIGVALGACPPDSAVVQQGDLGHITAILNTAHTLQDIPGAIEAYVNRLQKPVNLPTSLRKKPDRWWSK